MREKRITQEIMVGVTPEMGAAIEILCEVEGLKASQFLRQAGLQALVQRGYMRHPAEAYLKKQAGG
jgi:hypothetical protein